MYLLYMLYHCTLDMIVIIQPVVLIVWHPSIFWMTHAMNELEKVHYTVLAYLQSKGKLVIFG